ncbi:hypothetical protein SCALM49S_04499 [Streptomyces californicus]
MRSWAIRPAAPRRKAKRGGRHPAHPYRRQPRHATAVRLLHRPYGVRPPRRQGQRGVRRPRHPFAQRLARRLGRESRPPPGEPGYDRNARALVPRALLGHRRLGSAPWSVASPTLVPRPAVASSGGRRPLSISDRARRYRRGREPAGPCRQPCDHAALRALPARSQDVSDKKRCEVVPELREVRPWKHPQADEQRLLARPEPSQPYRMMIMKNRMFHVNTHRHSPPEKCRTAREVPHRREKCRTAREVPHHLRSDRIHRPDKGNQPISRRVDTIGQQVQGR